MTGRLRFAGLALLGLVVALASGVAAGRAAAMSGEEAAAKIEAAYGVEALRVRGGTVGGAQVWLITVMKPGADSNDAFQVTTLAVDKASGELVPAYRHGPHGTIPAEDAFATQIEQRPSALRSGLTWR